jgi:hypothetical protein
MNTWVVRVFGPAVANVTKERLLLIRTGSSLIRASRQTAETLGSPLTPNCTMKALDHPKEAGVVVEAVLDKIVKSIGAVWRPVAMNLDDERAFAGVEIDAIGRRSLFFQRRGIGEALAEGRRGIRQGEQQG